jgi:predicted ferric reductase
MNLSIQKRAYMRAAFYLGVVVTLGVIMTGWWSMNGGHLNNYADRLVVIGRLFGLLAAWSVILQIILMSRVPFIERNFDLHDNIQLHTYNGYAMLATISGHVIFLVLGYALPTQFGLWDQFVIFNTQYSDVFLATIGTIIFFGASALSLQVVRKKMQYEVWMLTHVTVYLAIAMTFLHQINTGGDFIHNAWFTAFWYALYILAFVLWLRYRVLQPLVLLLKFDFKVSNIEMAARSTYSVTLTGKHVENFQFVSGQYATWRFLSSSLWYEAHPFSISSIVGSNTLRFTVKATPSLTERIAQVPIGTRVIVDGPRGSFTAERADNSENVLLIAGGIGITPYLSTIDALVNEGKKVTLLYSARTNADVAFKQELIALEARGVVIRVYLTENSELITPDVIKSAIKDDSIVYICGPDAMSQSFSATLRGMGLNKKNIITERFAF